MQFERYKGIPIEVDHEGEFSTPDDEEDASAGVATICLGLRAATVVELRAKIDKALKKKFERFKVWTEGRWHDRDMTLATVTSVHPDGSLWTIDNRKHRERLYRDAGCWEDSPENAELVEAIRKHQAQIKTWERRIEALKEQMKRCPKLDQRRD